VVRIEIVGNRGEICDQFFRVPGRAVLAAGASDWVFERRVEMGQSPLEHLIDCLESGRQTVATIEDAYRAFVSAMAAYDAARLGRSVTIPPVA
jgi:predicted dehydrogenase